MSLAHKLADPVVKLREIKVYFCLGSPNDTDPTTNVNMASKAIQFKTYNKLYGEVNSVKKHNYKIWLNDGVY